PLLLERQGVVRPFLRPRNPSRLTWDFPVCRRASAYAVSARSGGRVAEGGGLLNRYRGLNPYRGFESPPLRHFGLRKRRFLPLSPMRRIRCAHAQESCAPDRKRDERL